MASDDPTEMVWEKMLVGRPQGTHLSRSRTSGGFSPLVRGDDSNELETQVTLLPVGDEDEHEVSDTVLKVAIGVAAGVAGTLVVVKAAARIKSRWTDLKSKRSKASERNEADGRAPAAEMVTLNSAASAAFSSEVDAVLEEHRTSMSSAEAHRRLLALLMAAAFIADQIRVLKHAHIEGDDASLELESALGKLASPQITDGINQMLEGDSSLLDEEASAEFMNIFGGGRISGGHYVPLRNENVREVLRLTGGEV
ncbi:hypothetical protein [Streptomyces sp. BK205]|uniref:hypothetical protein n=1 Tax=Streptomyces sp. BK205 TaxID=2512164 RepID=UPI00140436BD|nr:hypothetical protein [Streptomyces sp. BK205]